MHTVSAINLESALFRFLNITRDDLKNAKPYQLRKWLNLVEGLTRKERLRGLSRHYRYDLNRHIALSALRKLLNAALRN